QGTGLLQRRPRCGQSPGRPRRPSGPGAGRRCRLGAGQSRLRADPGECRRRRRRALRRRGREHRAADPPRTEGAGAVKTLPARVEPVDDPAWLKRFIVEQWGAPGVVSRGRLWTGEGLSALRWVDASGVGGVVSWRVEGSAWELMTLNSLRRFTGIGS